MSKKNLLNEAQVRQFMKLAKLEPLASGFVEGLAESTPTTPELEEVRNGAPPPGLESPRRGHGRGRGPEDRLEEEDELAQAHDLEDAEADIGHADALDVDAEEDLGDVGPDAGSRMVSVDDFLTALESTLETVLGDEVEIDSDGLDDDEESAEVEDEFAPEGDEVVADVEDELELQERDDEELEERQKYGGNKDEIPDADRKKKTHSGKPGQASKEDVEERGEKLNKESTDATDELIEQVTKRVAARILKAALVKK